MGLSWVNGKNTSAAINSNSSSFLPQFHWGIRLSWTHGESSTLTTGPKVLASKNWFGLVKIGNLEVWRAYKHFTVACFTSLNLSPTRGLVVSKYVLTRKSKMFCTWCSENHVTDSCDCKFDVYPDSTGIFLKREYLL